MPKLTKKAIDAMRPKASGDVFAWDSEMPGFGLRIKPSGAKSFIAQYRNRNGRSRRLTIGRYGILTPEEGRHRVKLVLADVLRGEDPAAARSADRSAMTVEDLCKEYLDRCGQGLLMTRRKVPKKASTLATDRGRVQRHVVPLIGTRTVKDLTSADLRAFVRDVIAGKTKADVKTGLRGRAIVTGGKGTATRTMALLSSILSYAVDEGYRSDNPARGVVLPAYKKRKVRLDSDQYRIFEQALQSAAAAGETWQAVLSSRLIALTGCRRGEVVGLRKSDIDLAGRMLRLSDSKTGESIRPLGAAAATIVREALLLSKSEFLFPAIRDERKPFGNLPKFWTANVKAVLPNVTPHTLRHSYGSVSDDLGYTEATTGAMLGHSGGGTTRGYIHKLDPALIAAADAVADYVLSAMRGTLIAADIISITRRA